LQKGESIAKLAYVYVAAGTSDRIRYFILFDVAFEQLLDINAVEPRRSEVEVGLLLSASFVCVIGYTIWLYHTVTDGVQIAIMQVFAASNI